MSNSRSGDLWINAALGFSTVLLLLLIIALATRIIYPRVQTEREGELADLIGEVIQVEVLNGCGVSGVASKFTNYLRQNGFDVIESGNFENFDVSESFVIDRTGNLQNALEVAAALGISERQVIQQITPDYYVDAYLVLGADYPTLKAEIN
jgi:hypothetical protein